MVSSVVICLTTRHECIYRLQAAHQHHTNTRVFIFIHENYTSKRKETTKQGLNEWYAPSLCSDPIQSLPFPPKNDQRGSFLYTNMKNSTIQVMRNTWRVLLFRDYNFTKQVIVKSIDSGLLGAAEDFAM
jgi:hypothetical protein